MGVFDFLKVNEYKKEVESLKFDLSELRKKEMSIEQMTVIELQEEILGQEKNLKQIKDNIEKSQDRYRNITNDISKKQEEINKLRRQFIVTEDDFVMESFGLYLPKYDFASSLGYNTKSLLNKS